VVANSVVLKPVRNHDQSISVAAQSEVRSVFLSNTESWVRILLRAWTYVRIYPVSVLSLGALRSADPLSKESYKLLVRFIVSEVNSELEQATGPNP
jgi:hypothetical protein